MQKPVVAIAMAAYNGEKYIGEQIDSIVGQTYGNWKLYIHDDGSTDKTKQIMEDYARRYPEQVILLGESDKKYGVCNNFFYILRHIQEDYVMFCDQDDVWLREKVAVTLGRMLKVEGENPGKPVLVHTDAIVTDEGLTPYKAKGRKGISSIRQTPDYKKSFYSNYHENKYQTSFANLLLKNSVQGMTIMLNGEMIKMAARLSAIKLSNSIWHDSLLASVASIVGIIDYYPIPTALYRQHNTNNAGVFEWHRILFAKLPFNKKYNRIRCVNYLLVNRPKAFLLRKIYYKEMSDNQKKLLNHFLKRPNDWKEFYELKLDREFTKKQIVIMRLFRIGGPLENGQYGIHGVRSLP